jgi:hypothetical protein
MAYHSSSKQALVKLTEDDLLRILVEGKNGKPNYGAILAYYRALMGWTAGVLAMLYGEALGDESVSASWVYIMENQNKVPADEKRRWILAQLLGIPPALFGLKLSTSVMGRPQRSVLNLFMSGRVDITEYRVALGQKDFALAVADFDAVIKLRPYVSPLGMGLVFNSAGRAYVHVAQDQGQLKEALKLMDEGAKAIGKEGMDMTISAKLDLERCHLNRGETLIVSPITALRNPAVARRELDWATGKSKPAFSFRRIENYVLQAESYFLQGYDSTSRFKSPDGDFMMAIACAEAALELLKATRADLYVARLENLYRRLCESTFGKSTDVAHLGANLLKAQQTGTFRLN